MRLDKYINEAGADFGKTIKKIKAMTSNNDHTMALAAGFKLLDDDIKANKAKVLAKKIEKAGGYAPGDPMDKEQQKLMKQMMDSAKANLSSGDYKKFHGSY